MCDRGYKLIERKVKYKKIFDELVQYNVVI